MQDNRLENLLTYTTFHIGVYVSLVTALIGAGIFNEDLGNSYIIRYTVACIFFAGMCGGIIGTNIPKYKSYRSYRKAKIGFYNIKPFYPDYWICLEHTSFWLGIIPLTFIFIFKWPCSI